MGGQLTPVIGGRFDRFMQFDHKVKSCSIDGPAAEISSLPDRRNLLFWNPDLKIAAEHPTKIKFRTPDAQGEYVHTVQGIDTGSGTKVSRESVFLVE